MASEPTSTSTVEGLVSDKLNGRTNYATWKIGMRLALEGKGRWKILAKDQPIDPSALNDDQINDRIIEWLSEQEEIPAEGFSVQKIAGNKRKWRSEQTKVYEKWYDLHGAAKSAIYHSCKPSVQQMIASCSTAKEQWDTLERAYSAVGFGNIILQTSRWTDLKLSECRNLEEYTNRFRVTFAELERLDCPVPNAIQASMYLNGLGSHFDLLVRDHNDANHKTINFEIVVEQAFNELRLRPLKKEQKLADKPKQPQQGASISRPGVGKSESTGNKRTRTPKSTYKCDVHGDNSPHSNERCWTQHPELRPSDSKVGTSAKSSADKTSSGTSNLVTAAEQTSDGQATLIEDSFIYNVILSDAEQVAPIQANRECTWQLDSGASHHMTNTKTNFVNFTYDSLTATTANNETIVSSGYGDVYIDLWMPEGQERTLCLQKVWHFPTLAVNLISFSQLEKQSMYILTQKVGDHSAGLYKTNRKVGEIQKIKNAYFLKTTGTLSRRLQKGIADAHVNKASDTKQSARLWHRRMAHLGVANLKQLPSVVEGADFTSDFGSQECDDCILANMKRLPRDGKAAGTATEINELIHTDLCGPITPESCKHKARYMMPVIDDYSRSVEIYFMREKSEAAALFEGHLNKCKTAGNPVRRVRFDNGGEYDNRILIAFLQKEGLLIEPTPAYSPESNGLAERTNQTLFYKVRVMMKDSRLPKFLWQHLVATAAYLHNRSPNKALEGKTPFEKLHGKKPDVSHLRVPGCRAFIHIPKEKRTNNKLDDRGQQCRFVGYTASKHMYLVYVDHTVKIARDIIFDEGPAIHGGATLETIPENNEPDDPEDVVIPDGEPVDYSSFFREENVPVNPADQAIDQTVPKRGRPAKTAPRKSVFSHVEIPRVSQRTLEPYQKLPPEQAAIDQDEDSAPIAQAFLAAQQTTGVRVIPWSEARSSSDWPSWRQAIQTEWNALVEMKTWEEVPLSSVDPKHRILTGHWVLTRKPDRFKARFVVHGNQQRKGIDYDETYAGTARSGSVKVLLSLAAINGWADGQLDACNAFLNAHLKDLVYIRPPPLFGKPEVVLRLLRALYGLAVSPREWWMELTRKLRTLGYRQCLGDQSVFVNTEGVILIVYVDDLALFAPNQAAIDTAKVQLMNSYKMRDIGHLKTFIGIQIERPTPHSIFIHQTDYCNHILERFGFTISTHSAREPMNSKAPLALRDTQCPEQEVTRYQEMVGSLMWLSTMTRPDIQYAVSRLAQFNRNPSEEVIQACKHVFRYLRGTAGKGILYTGNENETELLGYTDACWGDLDAKDPRSTTGYVFKLAGGPIAWASRRQRTTATSSTESEYISQCSAVKEASYLRQFLNELGATQQSATIVHGDNRGAIALSKGTISQTRSRHINFQYHYTRERVADGTVNIVYIPTAQMAADGLTKPLPNMEFRRFQDLIGVVDNPVAAVQPS